jgi:hypothetical protein
VLARDDRLIGKRACGQCERDDCDEASEQGTHLTHPFPCLVLSGEYLALARPSGVRLAKLGPGAP